MRTVVLPLIFVLFVFDSKRLTDSKVVTSRESQTPASRLRVIDSADRHLRTLSSLQSASFSAGSFLLLRFCGTRIRACGKSAASSIISAFARDSGLLAKKVRRNWNRLNLEANDGWNELTRTRAIWRYWGAENRLPDHDSPARWRQDRAGRLESADGIGRRQKACSLSECSYESPQGCGHP